MRVGYARVSTSEQSTAPQRDRLSAADCERIYEDVVSSTHANRPGLAEALDYAREGDALVVTRLDRLARSLKQLIETVEDLRARDIALISLDEQIDTTTATGRLVFHIFGSLAEFERNLIQERTHAGLSAARARGRKGGRPRRITPVQLETAARVIAEGRRSLHEAARDIGVSPRTLDRYVRRDGSLTDEGRQLASGQNEDR